MKGIQIWQMLVLSTEPDAVQNHPALKEGKKGTQAEVKSVDY